MISDCVNCEASLGSETRNGQVGDGLDRRCRSSEGVCIVVKTRASPEQYDTYDMLYVCDCFEYYQAVKVPVLVGLL